MSQQIVNDFSSTTANGAQSGGDRPQVAVVGAGSWGLALARVLAANGSAPSLWVYEKSDFEELSTARQLHDKLPGVRIPPEIFISQDIGAVARQRPVWVLAIPAQRVGSVVQKLCDFVPPDLLVVNVAKGIELTTGRRMSEVISAELQLRTDQIVTLSGPSHAEEVAAGMPTTLVAAGQQSQAVGRVQQLFSNARLRVYASDDLIGVELGGALKNVVALACGISSGLGLGDNTTGALVTRGLAEITRLGMKLGARAETFAGLSGIGDLVTTAISRHSRNRMLGERLGRGESLAAVLASMSMVAEGVETARATQALARAHGVEMPITDAVCRILFDGKSPKEAIQELMSRSLKPEVWQ